MTETNSRILIALIAIVIFWAAIAGAIAIVEYKQPEKDLYYFSIVDSSMIVYDGDDNYIGTTQLSGNIDSLLVDYYE